MTLDAWKRHARGLKRDTYALYLAARDPRVPWYTKALALGIVGCALSPIDLIPDFIPVVGYLDDLILVPLGLALVLRLTAGQALAEARARAQEAMDRGTPSRSWPARIATIVIILAWLAALALVGYLAIRAFMR